jgi:hypothetical protein
MDINGREYRQVTIGTKDFIVRAQDYMVKGFDNIERQQTRIEVIEYDVKVWGKTHSPVLLGVLTEFSDPFNSNPDLWDVPVFVPTQGINGHRQQGIYHGAIGLQRANEQLVAISPSNLRKGVQHYILEGS